MSTQAQIVANRRNAQKSTGPRTPEGKAIIAQNAVKHGLTAGQDIISSESLADFDLYRDRMLTELILGGEYVRRFLSEYVVTNAHRDYQ